MATWDEIGKRDPESIAVVGVLGALVRAVRRQPEHGYRGWSLATIEPVSPGIDSNVLGVGLLVPGSGINENAAWVPTLFVGGHEEWVELGDFPMRLAIGRHGEAGEAPIRIVGLPAAELLAGTGDRCDTPIEWGTLGARVTTKSGTEGVLIAGHVAGTNGTIVSDQAGRVLGAITVCVYPGQAPPQQASGDVAVVELEAGILFGGIAHATTPATVLPRDDLEIHGAATGTTRTWILGVSTFWTGPDPTTGDWASVLITKDGTTGPGDSGALVVRQGTIDPVGHVVGGKPGVYTLIQELDDQLVWAGGVSLR
jgi:hypothetical protein